MIRLTPVVLRYKGEYRNRNQNNQKDERELLMRPLYYLPGRGVKKIIYLSYIIINIYSPM